MDGKKKSVIDKFLDTVGEAVAAAVMPTRDIEAEAVAKKANEQMYLGDAAVAPEAVPALIAEKKRASSRRANKWVAKARAIPAKKSSPKKAAKKSAPKKSATKTKTAAKKSAKKRKKSKR
jgi:hypothetical protein